MEQENKMGTAPVGTLLLPLSWLLSKSGSLNRVFLAYPVADFVAALIGLIMVWYYYKKDIRELLNLNEKFY